MLLATAMKPSSLLAQLSSLQVRHLPQALQEELLSSRRTPEQRRAELAERARSLAARREGERQRLAQQLLDQQFKEGCDQLRGVESKKLTMDMIHQQQLQVSQITAQDARLRRWEGRLYAKSLSCISIRLQRPSIGCRESRCCSCMTC